MNTIRYFGLSLLILFLAMSLPGLALAQTAANAPGLGTISQTPQTARPERDIPPRAVLPGLDEPVVLAPAPPGAETLYVRAFRFQNAEIVSEETLQELVAPYAGHELTLAQLQEAAMRVTMYYQALGYFLAQAYLPQQDASNGEITIAIVIGRFGETYIDNQSLVTSSLVNKAFSRIKPGQLPNAKTWSAACCLRATCRARPFRF